MKVSEIRREMAKHGGDRFSAITAFNEGKKLGLVYHIIKGKKPANLTVIFEEKETIPSIADIFPSASLYETEAHELFGIKFDKLEKTRLFLPDDWKGKPPLRQ
jgi:NADH:ubiquinone oxidoreductase subunit C